MINSGGDYTVIVTNSFGCTDTSAVFNVTSYGEPIVSFSGLNPSYCSNAPAVTLTGNQAPYGIFSGPGITDNGNGTALFNPVTAGIGGPYTITYTYAYLGTTCSNTSSQQVTVTPCNYVKVTSSGGVGIADYPTLSDAFAAVNAGTHTGTIAVSIYGNTTEPATGAILNASGAGSASYSSMTVNPLGARTVSGAATAGLPLINFNAADNVTVDGLNSSGNSLTIENTTVSATAGTSTIQFIGGATGNTITRCTLKGAGTSSASTTGAIVFFSTDAVSANGNDNNTIANCDIGPSGANLPSKAILGSGSTTTTAIGNSGIIINNNDIHDFFGAAVSSSGLATIGGCNTWSVTNNRFYQTGTRTFTAGIIHRAIDINNTTTISGAQGFIITGNKVGYASSTQTGTYTLNGSAGKFQAIVFNGISVVNGGTAVTTVSNNTVSAVSLTGVTSSGTSTLSPFVGILLINGLVNSNNNIVGSQSATGDLAFSTNTTGSTEVYGIFNFTLDNWVSDNNTIGGISVTNAGASGTFLVNGMRANTSSTKTWNALSNIIGGTVANSIQLNSTGTGSQLIGMQSPNAGCTLAFNAIRNLTSNSGTTNSVAGILLNSTVVNHTISKNTIYSLTNTNTTNGHAVQINSQIDKGFYTNHFFQPLFTIFFGVWIGKIIAQVIPNVDVVGM